MPAQICSMWHQISSLFAGFPAQKLVAKKMIDLGLGIGADGRIVCDEVEVKEVSLASACGVDRRVVSATVHSILSDRQAARLFSGIRPAGTLLSGIAHELGFGVVELEANAKKPAIIAHATALLAKRRISIRQVYAKDPELYDNPTLVIITERPIP